MFNCVHHLWILNTITFSCLCDCQSLLHDTSVHKVVGIMIWCESSVIHPPILAQPCGQSNPLPLIVPLAQEIPCKKRRFNGANVSSKPTYAGWVASSPRRAFAAISTHDYNFGVRHAIVKETICTKRSPHVAHVAVWGPRPL